MSKYIGEIEKHIDAVFADAERSGAVLLPDEADALFGKIAILTTNMRANLDEAFLRRLRFVVEFPPRS